MSNEVSPPVADDLGLLEKYRIEREKRLRSDGTSQFVTTEGKFAHFVLDPFIDTPLSRAPLVIETDVLIVGGGLSGLMMGANLKKLGVEDVRIVETAASFGGAWYWNRYPGCRCDVDSCIYLPFLEDVGYMPTEKYATSDEIRHYLRSLGKHFRLDKDALFETQVTRVEWDEDIARWVVATNRHDEIKARYVVIGSGPLNHPKLPGIPGIETFKGKQFHTSRWDYDYTGGDPSGNMTQLKNKRVAVIGTGATGVQVAPPLAEWSEHLYVVQRTPAIVGYRGNKLTDMEWAKTLGPGWQEERMADFEGRLAGLVTDGINLVDDEWTEIFSAPSIPPGATPEEAKGVAQHADIEVMNKVRARIDAIVQDRATAEALKPWYGRFCKRPTFTDLYLPIFNRPNVTLVDTQGKGLDRITEDSIVVDGQSYKVDLIVHATGFEILRTSHETSGFVVVGRDGQQLEEKWSERVSTLHGVQTNGFPNLFIVTGYRQSAPTLNFVYYGSKQAEHVAKVIRQLLDTKAKIAEVTKEAEERWGRTIEENLKLDMDYIRACTPSYFNGEGDPTELGKLSFTTAYGEGYLAYFKLMEEWRRSGLEEDMRLVRE